MSSKEVKTVKVKHGKGDYRVINECDFVEGVDELFVEPVKPAVAAPTQTRAPGQGTTRRGTKAEDSGKRKSLEEATSEDGTTDGEGSTS